MTQPTYTFVIPHYNIPSLLERCLDSIPERDDIQIVVVDDGSKHKPQITRSGVELVLLPKHTNAGNARNAGLSRAKGKWVLFPDADDFYNKGFLDELDKYGESDHQLIFFSVNSCDSETLEPMDMRTKVMDGYIQDSLKGDPKALTSLLYTRGNVCHMMFLREFIEAYDFRFESAVINNDVLFHINVCYHVKDYIIIPQQLYCLTYRKGSIQFSDKSLACHYCHICHILKFYCFHQFIGINKRKPLCWYIFWGYDNRMKKKTRVQRHINRSIFFLKSLCVSVTHIRKIYGSRMLYVEEIKRCSAYKEEHSNG